MHLYYRTEESHDTPLGYLTVAQKGLINKKIAEEGVIVLVRCPHFRGLKCMQEWYLGWEKVSCLERCPQFRSVLREREVPLYIYRHRKVH